jgi:lysophospholipase L1-like esterase
MSLPPRLLSLLLFLLVLLPLRAADDFLPGAKRVVFLGDSITYGGNYVDDFELYLFCRYPARKFEVLNVGLPSETVSGLSEEGHANGKFPRPDLHERLDRVLAKTKPNLVFACYGMNDGIYLPLDDARFAKYREGILKLREKVTAAGAQIIHLTPPTFHHLNARPQPGPDGKAPASMLGGYNEVLDRYSAWLLEQRAQGWRVIDIHGPMNAFIEAQRKTNPDFVFAKDGVHANEEGHALMADQLIASLAPADVAWWKKLRADLTANPQGAELKKLIRQRGRILCDAYLNDAGHLRPGMAKGLPVAEAETKAAELEEKIRALVKEMAIAQPAA